MVDSSSNELASTFRAKAVFMKTWKPPNTPSVRMNEIYFLFSTLHSMIQLVLLFSYSYSFKNCSYLFSFFRYRIETDWSCLPYINKLSPGMLLLPFPPRPPALKRQNISPGAAKAVSRLPKPCSCICKKAIVK